MSIFIWKSQSSNFWHRTTCKTEGKNSFIDSSHLKSIWLFCILIFCRSPGSLIHSASQPRMFLSFCNAINFTRKQSVSRKKKSSTSLRRRTCDLTQMACIYESPFPVETAGLSKHKIDAQLFWHAFISNGIPITNSKLLRLFGFYGINFNQNVLIQSTKQCCG